MASTTLYPPIIDAYMPAFTVSDNSSYCRLYFSMSEYSSSIASVASTHISIIKQSSGQSAVRKVDNAGAGRYRATGIIILNQAPTAVAGEENLYYIDILNEDVQKGDSVGWQIGWLYKVQIRLSTVAYDGTIGQAAWLNINANNFSEWSTFCIIKAIGIPMINIPILHNSTLDLSTLEVIGDYSNLDKNETLYSYRFKLYQNGILKEVSDEDIVNGKIVIPEGVIKIDNGIFNNNPVVKEVVCPNSLREIGDDAFSSCHCLTNIKLNDGIVKIGKNSFYYCSSLELDKLPKNLEKLSSGAFSKCFSIKSIELPENLTKVESDVFWNCSKLTSVKLGKNITEIGNSAFKDCVSLTNINLGNSIVKIDNNAFYGCQSLKATNLPSSLTSLGSNAFSDCISLRNVNFPKGLTEIKSNTFHACYSLKNISIPSSITKIESSAFSNCSKLKSATLPKSLEEIPDDLFCGCVNLKNVSIPESIKKIGDGAFADCYKLKSVNLPNNLNYLGSNTFNNCRMLKAIKLPNSITYIGEGAFHSCDKLREVELPQSLKEIKDKTFAFCLKLSNIEIPNSIEKIGKNAFENCLNLMTVSIPDSVKNIGDAAFCDCYNLDKVKLPINLTKINDEVFKNCTNLKEVNIPQSVTVIEDGAFNFCKSLREIKLPEKLTSIGENAFSECTGLANIQFPKTLKTIERMAFSNCTSLPDANLPNGLTELGEYAFNNCENIEYINIPTGLTKLNNGVFNRNIKLNNFDIPKNITSIGAKAFADCKRITDVHIPSSVESIGEDAFLYCYSIENFVIDDGLETIDDGALFGCSNLRTFIAPKTLKSIGDFSLGNCFNLSRVELNEGLVEIGANAFSDSRELKNLYVPSTVKKIGEFAENSFKYFTKRENGFILSSENISGSIKIDLTTVNLNVLSSFWNYKNLILREEKDKRIYDFYRSYVYQLPHEQVAKFIKSHNFTFFKQLNLDSFDKNNDNMLCLYKLTYNLGLFEKPMDINGRKIDYAQKVGNFLIQKIQRKELVNSDLVAFENMEDTGIKPEFTDFFMSSYGDLFEAEQDLPGFIAKCYNLFEAVQRTNTNNHGSQRQLKPTVLKFIEYFKENKFVGITPETKFIADTISPFFSKQIDFDNAVNIELERIEKNSPTSILSSHLKESIPEFSEIDDLSYDVKIMKGKIMGDFAKISNNEFTFDWLEKNDPNNFILGKFCSCCAHLEGVGYSIMHASMVDPNVQNLVIRNKDGIIVAKSTLYINPKEGYGVFNNVEINEQIPKKQEAQIYKKYYLGIKTFAEQYNKEHPDNPLMQINVGMHLNDLSDEIKSHHKEASHILKAIDYKKYGIPGQDYNGDSNKEQYVIWQNEEKQKD